MLTKLSVRGFKSLRDVSVSFGPFTCLAGAAGSGKTNLLEAIELLSALADRPLRDAAAQVARSGDPDELFRREGDGRSQRIELAAEFLVPGLGRDELGQAARPSITFLRYAVALGRRSGALGGLELLDESLSHINQGEARVHLPFPHKPTWRRSAVTGKRSGTPFISTHGVGLERTIEVHQDGGDHGRRRTVEAAHLGRTVLSTANGADTPTALLARETMRRWRLMQLHAPALGQPDDFGAPDTLGRDGAHLAATIYRLCQGRPGAQILKRVGARLASVYPEVRELRLVVDDARRQIRLEVIDGQRTSYPIGSLGDGCLGLLGLATLAEDPMSAHLLCLDGPERGLHPAGVPPLLDLLQGMVSDVRAGVSSTNPLRQVIVSSHAPAVVAQLPGECLLVAQLRGGATRLVPLVDTWRSAADAMAPTVSSSELYGYFGPISPAAERVPSKQSRQTLREDATLSQPGFPGI
jgi:predicted ATPase